MKYSGIIYNDFAGAPGVQLTFFTQGCPFHCKNCHNPETWSYEGGKEFTLDTLQNIITGLTANGVTRTLGIQGGEPLCPENLFLTWLVIKNVKEALPATKIYIWTGYLYEDLLNSTDQTLKHILDTADVLIDGPYIDAERDITLPLAGSRNQRVINLKENTLC